MKTGTEIFSLFIAVSLLFSCEYDTGKVYNRDVVLNPDPPVITPAELHIDGDTVYVYGSTEFNFSFTSSNQAIIGAGFSVDDADSMFVISENGQYRYRTGFLVPGIHVLKLDLVIHSGTSSIADILGAEGFVFTKTWTLVVINNYYSYLTEHAENGYLKISFPEYLNRDLVEYEISRFVSNGFAVIGRVRSPEFTDSTYVGEGGTYKINVITRSGDIINWAEANFNSLLPGPQCYTDPDGGYFLSWNSGRYFNAVKSYFIEISTPYQGIDGTYTTNPPDTILSLPDLHYGDVKLVRLRFIPKNGNLLYESGDLGYRFEVLQYITAGLQ